MHLKASGGVFFYGGNNFSRLETRLTLVMKQEPVTVYRATGYWALHTVINGATAHRRVNRWLPCCLARQSSICSLLCKRLCRALEA
jgi:hypothetical protein